MANLMHDPEIAEAVMHESLSAAYGWTEQQIRDTSTDFIMKCLAVNRGKHGTRTEAKTDG